MNRTLLVLILFFGCLCLWAEPVPEGAVRHFEGDSLSVESPAVELAPESDWALAVGMVPLITKVNSSGDNAGSWHTKIYLSYHLRLFHRFPGPFELQTGLSQQNTGSKGKFSHPEPYVLSYVLDLKGQSLRVPLMLNWTFLDKPQQSSLYFGMGGYVDWIYDARLGISRKYVTGIETSSRNPRGEMGEQIPGLQVQIGSRAGTGRVELVYWTDLPSFNLVERGSEELRRNGIFLSYSVEFLQF